MGGASILYWLTRLGWDDVVLVERADLTSGSTFHSAGLVGQLRGSLGLTRMMMNSVELYRTVGEEAGLETGWREVGSLRLASSEERLEELRRQAGWAATFGLPLELVSADEARELFPPMSTDGVLGAAYLPTDGYIDLSQLTFALAQAARNRGAEVATSTRVTGIDVERGRVTGVQTDKGPIEAEVVVNAGGMFAGEIGALAGVTVPIVPMAHEYLITKPSETSRPTCRRCGIRRSSSTSAASRAGSSWAGTSGIRRRGGSTGSHRLQRASARGGLGPLRGAPDERDRARARARGRRGREARQRARGVHPGRRVHPRALRRARLLGCGRLLRTGSRAGGMGQLVAEWIVEGVPSLDTWEMDSRRFGLAYSESGVHLARTTEVYATYYDVKYPGHEREASRPLRLSPTYERLRELGAVFGEKSGWERANWFEPNAERGDESLRPRGWAGRLWSPAIGAEHRSCPRGRGALRRVVLREDRGRWARRGRVPGGPLRQPRRARRRRDHLHADAERPWGSSATSRSRGSQMIASGS